MRNFNIFKVSKLSSLENKFLISLLTLFVYQITSKILIRNIDQVGFSNTFSFDLSFPQSPNSCAKESSKFLTLFYFGINPYILISFVIDIITLVFENLFYQDELENKEKIKFYKRRLSFLFVTVQAWFFTIKIKDFFYLKTFLGFLIIFFQFILGFLIANFLHNIIETYGIQKGTSLIILTNIFFSNLKSIKYFFLKAHYFDYLFVSLVIICLTYLNTFSESIKIINTKELQDFKSTTKTFFPLSHLELKLLKFELFPLLLFYNSFKIFQLVKKRHLRFFHSILVSICVFIYHFASLNSEKIADSFQKEFILVLYKAQPIPPGKKTANFLKRKAFMVSIASAGLSLIFLSTLDFFKQLFPQSIFLMQINLMQILVILSVCLEIFQKIKALLYENHLQFLTSKTVNFKTY